MRKYRITGQLRVNQIVEIDDEGLLCSATAPPLTGLPVTGDVPFLSLCRMHGLTVTPILDRVHSTALEYEGTIYDVRWSGEHITRITMYEPGEAPTDITYNDLPEEVQKELD